MARQATTISGRLPKSIRLFFWDHDTASLRWDRDPDLIVARVLAAGDWGALCWLRDRMPDEELRAWLTRRRGAGLSRRQLRFWETVLGLPRQEVDAWLAAEARKVWDNRRRR